MHHPFPHPTKSQQSKSFQRRPGMSKIIGSWPPNYLYYGQKIRTPALPSKSSTTFRLYWGAHHVANFLAHPDHCIAPATVPPWLPLNFKAPNFRSNMGQILTNWFTLVYGLHLIYLITSWFVPSLWIMSIMSIMSITVLKTNCSTNALWRRTSSEALAWTDVVSKTTAASVAWMLTLWTDQW